MSVGVPSLRTEGGIRQEGTVVIVDCDRCAVRGDACHDCVISVLFGAPPGVADGVVGEVPSAGPRPAFGLFPVGSRRRQPVDGASSFPAEGDQQVC
jgi:hypothetical protein